jgi:deoxyribose-phosphate aldolase
MSDDAQRETAARALHLLDLTDLSDNCRAVDIDSLCRRAKTPFGPVAAVCTWPRFVAQAKRQLAASGVRVAAVINFPDGGDDIERAVSDTRETLRDGADEIDLVMPYRAYLAGNIGIVGDLIRAVADEFLPGHSLKVILETGALKTKAHIAEASRLAIAAGAHFLKTSTGKTKISATPEAARVMLDIIHEDNPTVGFKASGGIRTIADAQRYLHLADDRMGADWVDIRHFRIGASGLLEVLLACLEQEASSGHGKD